MSEQKNACDEEFEKYILQIRTVIFNRKRCRAKTKRAKFEKLCSCKNVLSDSYFFKCFIEVS